MEKMDQEVIDEMYEGIGDANGDIHNEDSVDIYSGLDTSPKTIADEKTCTRLSPRVLESMDLYEEILAEEQESKESSYNELKTRFSAAINQIEELRKRLELMETQNTALSTQNCRLKKNISALIRTARMEVVRKDKEIYRLNNGSGRTLGHHFQPHMNGLRDQLSSSTPNGSRISVSTPLLLAQPILPRDERLSKNPPLSVPKSQEATFPPNASPAGTPASRPPPHTSSKCSTKADLEPPTKNTDSLGALPSGSESRYSDKPQAKHRDSKTENSRKSERTDGRLTNGLDHEKECESDMARRSLRVDRESGKSNLCLSNSRNHPDLKVHRRLDRAKSPPPDLLRISALSSSYRSKEKSETQSRVCHREPGKDTNRDAYCRSSQKASSKEHWHSHSKLPRLDDRPKDSKHIRGTSPLRENLRKEERKREEFRREERRSSKKQREEGERSREREGKPSKSVQRRDDVRSKEAKKRVTEMSGVLLKGQKVSGKSSQEENSPNRKLCFMETLNLTLSPVKKPTLPGDSKKKSCSPVHNVIEIGTENDSEQPDVDDMCVIDEIGCSFSETDVVSVVEFSKPPECPQMKEQQLDHKENDQTVIKTLAPAIREVAENDIIKDNVEYIPKRVSEVIDGTKEENIKAPAPEQPEQPCVSTVEPATVCALGRTAAKTGITVSVTGLTVIAGDSPNSDASNVLHQTTPKKTSRDSVGVSDMVSLDTDLSKSLPVEKVSKESSAILSSCTEDTVDNVQHTTQPPQHLSPVKFSSTPEKEVYDTPKDGDAVSSTISMEVLPEEMKLSEAISHFTQMEDDVPSITIEPCSSTGVSRVTSTTEEDSPPEKHSRDLMFTPKKSCGSAPGLSEERCAESTCSIPLNVDEDSMMLTLNSLKRIPDVISPLTSPMHPTKRAQPHLHSKPAHVKSLRKDFLNIAADATSIKLDVNKENKHPDCPLKHPAPNSVDKTSKFPSIVPEDEIEEGEIVSDSEEEAVSTSPSNMTVKSARPSKNESNSPSFSKTSKRLAEEKLNASKRNSDWKNDVGSPSSTGSPSSNKSRLYKTICPALPNTSFSTAEEVMDVFKTIRFEVRKKYMKLHKTFPKKNFYGIVDNSIESFLEFVHVANLSLLCSHSDDLKVQLKNMITSVLSKVSNNGIVNRIFDQQSTHLKQKLWNFVDVQLDFLFKEIQSVLEGFVESKTVNHASRVHHETVPSENNKTSNCSPMKNTTKPKAPRREELQQVKKNKSIRSQTLVPCRTGLGSRGKDIRSILERQEKDPLPYQPGKHVTLTPPKRKVSTPEKVTFVGQLSHSGSMQDSRSDFEILTEQQASSLTFNLVRDTQMGEIFKCLLQGSDLLDNSVAAGDGWPVGTPRKEAHALERLGITSPNRVRSPSKLIATWASVSSSRMSSPQSKLQRPPNPAYLDESCLLEVPFELAHGRMTPQRNLFPQSPYSILAEDLAVSLTIPSPLKSDSHLSFLHPASVEPVSAPDSVISAHFSEDALMDGEDATEQDIHLVLDTDNSSCDSSNGRSAEPLAPPLFHFKPDLPMQAVVMERSNDHFIVRIRHASTSPAKSPLTGESFGERWSGEELGTGSTDVTLRAEESVRKTLFREELCNGEENLPGQKSPTQALSSMSSLTTVCCETGLDTEPSPLPAQSSDAEMEDSRIFENSLTIAEEDGSTSEKDQTQSKRGKKRKAERKKPKAKRFKNAEKHKARKEKSENSSEVSKSEKSARIKSSKKERCYPSSCVQLSPNSLYAKNVIKKKGEVMVTWTRDEDRAILVDLKVKGATSNTFSALSEKLHKSQAQIAERFAQLMKLFKKTEKAEKMEN